MSSKTLEQPRVGRPTATVRIPKGRFTFNQLCEANSHLAPLTLRNFMDRDKGLGKHSQILRIEDERGEPGSNIGFGRKPFLYIHRESLSKGSKVIGYHVHTAKAPSHPMKRTETKNGSPHSHHVVQVGKGVNGLNGASILISFGEIPPGSPIPTSVTVNLLPRNGTPQVTTVEAAPQIQEVSTETSSTPPVEPSQPV